MSKSLGRRPEQQVAHRAAHHEGRVARALQLLAGAPRAAADELALDRVLVLAVDDRARVLVRDAVAAAEQLVDVFFDHCSLSEMMGQPRSGGVGPQGGVGIDRHGMRHALEQRQVVQRIAVEPALVVGEPVAALREPLVHALDLALPEGGRAARLSSEDAVDLLDVGGDQRGHAQLGGDGLRDEAVGRGDDRGERIRMPRDQLRGARQDHRPHLALHELVVPGVELRARAPRDRRQLEVEELVDVERAVLVALVEPLVLRVVLVGMQHALLDQELRPRVVAVAVEERVVEVEERELHREPSIGRSGCSAALSSGTVTGRPVSSE